MNITYVNSVYDTSYNLIVRGDVDSNGLSNKIDSNTIANHIISNNIISTDTSLAAADYNDDGLIRVNDVMKILSQN